MTLTGLAQMIETVAVRQRDRLPWVHAAMFVVFLVVIAGPLAFRPLAAYANYALWGLWFPLVFLSVIATGRSWCGLMCPMGAAAEWANRIGPQRPIPRWLRWEGMPVVSFLIITILGQTLGVRDHPEAAAEVFGGTMAAAILTGFLYGRRKRAWCRHACPIGLLLGVFSRLGAVDFAPRGRTSGAEGYTDKGPCPTMIDLGVKHESRHCIECLRCVNPQAKGGIHVALRRPGREVEEIAGHNPNPTEVWFLFMGTGVALGGFLWLVLPQFQDLRQAVGEWAVGAGWSWLTEPGPAWLMSVHPDRNEVFLWLDFGLIVGFMLGCMALLTALLAALTAAAAALAGGPPGFAQRFTQLGYQYAPVAMVSLVVGLGGLLFEPLRLAFGPAAMHAAKGGMFLLGLAWSLHLGRRILARQGGDRRRRWLALLPGLAGSVLVGLAWWPAIFGL